MELGLRDKTALVTGGSKGIGRAVAGALAAEGARVMICARDGEALTRAAEEIEAATGRPVLTTTADLSELSSVARVEWLHGWSLKLLGYIRMAREILPHMQRQGGGRIINVVGAAARNPSMTYMMGGTANAALINFTKALADLGARSNVLVTAVSPGPVKTERWDNLARQQALAVGRDVETYVKEQNAGMPLGRIALPEEVADLVCFLASERAAFLTGITITVDGGSTRGVYL